MKLRAGFLSYVKALEALQSRLNRFGGIIGKKKKEEKKSLTKAKTNKQKIPLFDNIKLTKLY